MTEKPKIHAELDADVAKREILKPQPEPKTKEPATVTLSKQNHEQLQAVVAAARELQRGWLGTGFFDRQDHAQARAPHDALEGHK